MKGTRNMRALLVGSMSLFLAATGCGLDEGATTTVRGSGRPIVRVRKNVPRVGTKKGSTGKPTDPGGEKTEGGFVYKPGRDPFKSYFDVGVGPQLQVKLKPLQKHPLSKLNVIAIITGTVQPAAMIVDPSGKPHMVKRGTLIGPPRGRIARILSDRIVVEREYKDRLERVHRLVHEIKIRKEPNEDKDAAR